MAQASYNACKVGCGVHCPKKDKCFWGENFDREEEEECKNRCRT